MAARKKAAADKPANTAKSRRRTSPEFEARKWKPGQSGNPKGRPRNPFKEAIEKAIPPKEFAKKIAAKVADGDSRVIVALMDRHFPKPEIALKLEHSGPDGAPIQSHFKVEFVKPDDDAG